MKSGFLRSIADLKTLAGISPPGSFIFLIMTLVSAEAGDGINGLKN
jgi:hypothetical protein